MSLARHLNLEHRPSSLADFVGQKKIKSALKVMLGASQLKNQVLPHILFSGPPGTGKTSLATVIANEAKMNIKYTQGSMFDKKANLINIFSTLNENTILFIDEIHALPVHVEEMLYSIMEDFVIDIVLGVEANSKIVRMEVKPFTLIGSTTKLELLSKPFKDRFGYLAKVRTYEEKDIAKIIRKSANRLKLKLDDEVIDKIANSSQLTPRIALHLLARINDYYIYHGYENLGINKLNHILNELGIYQFGLNEEHIQYLQTLSEVFNFQYASLNSLAGILNNSRESIMLEIEPALINYKLIEKSPRGRKLTTAGRDYLKKLKP